MDVCHIYVKLTVSIWVSFGEWPGLYVYLSCFLFCTRNVSMHPKCKKCLCHGKWLFVAEVTYNHHAIVLCENAGHGYQSTTTEVYHRTLGTFVECSWLVLPCNEWCHWKTRYGKNLDVAGQREHRKLQGKENRKHWHGRYKTVCKIIHLVAILLSLYFYR